MPERTPPAKAEADAMLVELAAGAAKVFHNAADLYHEAAALHKVGAISRAYFLHQISLEECAKIEMLGAWAVSVLTGMAIDKQKLTIAFASHRSKNYTNAYLLPVTEAESDAHREKRWEDALTAFKEVQAAFHRESNAAKNGSLYVDLDKGVFTAPRERITEDMVAKIADRNEEYLGGAYTKTRMLTKWTTNATKAREMTDWFETRLAELMSQSENPRDALFTVLEEMLPRAVATGYAEAMAVNAQETEADK